MYIYPFILCRDKYQEKPKSQHNRAQNTSSELFQFIVWSNDEVTRDILINPVKTQFNW